MAENKTTDRRMVPARYDIAKKDHGLILTLEMPGVPKDGLEIRVEGDHLFVEGKKLILRKEGKFVLHEIREADYGNVFTLDETIDRDKIEAKMENGVVTIDLSLRESEKPKKIKVIAK